MVRVSMSKLSIKLWIVAVVIAIMLLMPLSGVPIYWIRFLTYLFLWIGLAGSFNTVYGYTGRVDFGHVVFFGVGAYTTAILLLNTSTPWPLSLFLGGVIAAVVAFFVGIPTLKLHGAYFAIATWALAEAIKQLCLVLDITGGSYGLVPPPVLGLTECYYLMFFSALAMTLTNLFIEKSKLGYALRAIRASEIAAETLGVDIGKYRLLAFMISAFFPGLIGGIYGILISYVYPYDVFEGLKTDQMVIMALLGGSGNYIGPVIGAIILVTSLEILWTYFTEILYLIFLGVLIVIVVVFLPQGIIGLFKGLSTKKFIENKLKVVKKEDKN